LLYDLHWQGAFVAENKGKYPFLLAVHSLTWAMMLFGVMILLHRDQWEMLPVLAVTHYAIDLVKCKGMFGPNHNGMALALDQLFHIVTIIGVARY
jgi:hypothetical protein